MTRPHLAILTATILITTGLLTGCTQPTTTPAQELQTILAKINNTPSLTFNLSSSVYNITMNATIQERKPYSKFTIYNDHNQSIYLFRPDGSYYYNQTSKTWTKNPGQTTPSFIVDFIAQLAGNITHANITRGTLYGFPVHIFTNHTGQVTLQVWIWDDYGVPLQTQQIINNTIYSLAFYSYYSFNPLPDSTFNIQ